VGITLDEALKALAASPFTPVAGGTDLMVRRRPWQGTVPHFDAPPLFVGRIPELVQIKKEEGSLVIGSAVTLADVMSRSEVPGVLRGAVSHMASPAIRNMGTLGGNICNASPAGDSLPPLYALGASVCLQSSSGRREMPLSAFITGPGKTARRPDELLVSVKIPLGPFDRVFYRKVGARKADAISKLSIACLAQTEGGVLCDLRITLGAVGPTVVRLEAAERSLAGRSLKELARNPCEVSSLYTEAVRPIDDQRSTAVYRKKVALGLIEQFISALDIDAVAEEAKSGCLH
jgi:xanthine dehydrogenase FAD-binding subunit